MEDEKKLMDREELDEVAGGIIPPGWTKPKKCRECGSENITLESLTHRYFNVSCKDCGALYTVRA